MKSHYIFILIAFFAISCASSKLKLNNWQKLPETAYTIPPFSRHLAQYKIALDPGHGGNKEIPGYKRGPSGKREAEMNLRVAVELKHFLELAGASVFLTREDDSFVALKDRAAMSAATGCDFMISLHHNASENPNTNYAAVFYHLTPEQSVVSMDLARNIYFGLVEALRLPQVLDDGLLSDRLFYPAGYGVLRRSAIPALLLESSFFSNPREEKRLTRVRYNRREAYGIFLGLARWAAGGVPVAQKIEPTHVSISKKPVLQYSLSDGIAGENTHKLGEQLLLPETVVAKIDGERVQTILSKDLATLTLQPDSSLSNGYHFARIDFQNMFKNSNFPKTDTLIVSAPVDSILFECATQYLPADSVALAPVHLSFYDAENEKVWDSVKVNISVDRGTVFPMSPKLRDGQTTVYYQPENELGLVRLVAASGAFADTLLMSLIPRGEVRTLTGKIVSDLTKEPVAAVKISLNDSIFTTTDGNGRYFFLNPPAGGDALMIEKTGYAPQQTPFLIDSLKSQRMAFSIKPNLGGLLFGETIILDAAFGDTVTGDFFADSLAAANANLSLAKELFLFLNWAGAKPILVREGDTWSSADDRIKFVNPIPEGWYLRLVYAYEPTDSVKVQATIYPANKVGEKIAASILEAFRKIESSVGVLAQNIEISEVTLTNKTALEVKIRCLKPDIRYHAKLIFKAIINYYKTEQLPTQTQN